MRLQSVLRRAADSDQRIGPPADRRGAENLVTALRRASLSGLASPPLSSRGLRGRRGGLADLGLRFRVGLFVRGSARASPSPWTARSSSRATSRRVDGISRRPLHRGARQATATSLIGTGNEGRLLKVTPGRKGRDRRDADGEGGHGGHGRARRRDLRRRLARRQGLPDREGKSGPPATRRRRSTSGRWRSPGRRSTWRRAFPARSTASSSGKGERSTRPTTPTSGRSTPTRRGGLGGDFRLGARPAGGPSGLVTTVYDSSKLEVTSIAGSADGRVWVAAGSAEAPTSSQEPISAPQPVPSGRPSRQSQHARGRGGPGESGSHDLGRPASARPRPSPARGRAATPRRSCSSRKGSRRGRSGRARTRSSSISRRTEKARRSWRRPARTGSSTGWERTSGRSSGHSTRSR